MLVYPNHAFQKLGFDSIKKTTANRIQSTIAEEMLDELLPSDNSEAISKRLDRTQEMLNLLDRDDPLPLNKLHDIRPHLEQARIEGNILSPEALVQIAEESSTVRRVFKYLDDRKEYYPELMDIAKDMTPLKPLEKELTNALDEYGEVHNRASNELANIRRQLSQQKQQLDQTLNNILKQAVSKGLASDEGATLRNGRMVIPIRAEHKRKMDGFVHDVSATGQTVYLEPVQALNINNEIRRLQSAEKQEIERILKQLTDQVRSNSKAISANYQVLGWLDLIQSMAEISSSWDGLIPAYNEKSYIKLKNAYNPLLMIRKAQGREDNVVPLELELSPNELSLIITGPNAGGKSVALKTLGLYQLLLQTGYALPAHPDSDIPIIDSIFVDMGDDQSIEEDLSTFSSRLDRMRDSLKNSGRKSLILIDEAGAGTDPDEGGALFQSLIEKLMERGSRSIVTTHHGSLKVFAHNTEGVVNGSMAFDQETLSPTYIFQKGIPGSSYAFEIARRRELPEDLLDRARELVGSNKQKLESLINDLEKRSQEADELISQYINLNREAEKERAKYEEKRSSIDKEREQIKEKALKEAKEIMNGANRRIEEAVRKISKQADDQGPDKQAIKGIRQGVEQHKEQIYEELDELESHKRDKKQVETGYPPEVGNQVRFQDSNTTGELVEVEGNNAVVNAGGLRLKTKYNNLIQVQDSSKAGPKSSGAKQKARSSHRISGNDEPTPRSRPRPSTSLDVRGYRGQEAVQTVSNYLDDVVASGMNNVEIVHGKGKGILRQLIHEHLKSRPDIKKYENAPWDQGGPGCTVVHIK